MGGASGHSGLENICFDEILDPQSRTLPLDKKEGSGDTETKLENENGGVKDSADDIMEKATTRKEDVPIDVNKRQAEENGDLSHKMVSVSDEFLRNKYHICLVILEVIIIVYVKS